MKEVSQKLDAQAGNVPVLLLEGTAALQSGNAEAGVAKLEQAAFLAPDNVEVLTHLGIALARLGRHEQALIRFEQASDLQPERPDLIYNRAKALETCGRLDDAILVYDQVISSKDDYFQAHNNKGNILLTQGEAALAVPCFQAAIHHNPNFVDAYNNLGRALSLLGRDQEAIAVVEKGLALDETRHVSLNNLGVLCRLSGDKVRARVCFEKAIAQQSDYAEAHRNLAMIKTYTEDDAQLVQMKKLLSGAGLSENDRALLAFAIAKGMEDVGDLDGAFDHLLLANRLRKAVAGYDQNAEITFFCQTKTLFDDLRDEDFPDIVSGDQHKQPIFILGMPRSGTTLVEQIVSSHSRVFGAGELELMRLSVRHSGWVGEMPTRDQVLSMRNYYLDGLSALGQGQPIVTDKMPLNFRWIGLIRLALPEARIIHVKRDARATCWSIFKQNFASDGNKFANDLEDVAHYYTLYVDLMEYWSKRYPGFVYDLNYEQLTEHQEDETRKLINWLGLPWEDDCLSFQDNRRYVATASSDQVRQKMYRGSSDAWRQYEQYLGPMMDILSGH